MDFQAARDIEALFKKVEQLRALMQQMTEVNILMAKKGAELEKRIEKLESERTWLNSSQELPN